MLPDHEKTYTILCPAPSCRASYSALPRVLLELRANPCLRQLNLPSTPKKFGLFLVLVRHKVQPVLTRDHRDAATSPSLSAAQYTSRVLQGVDSVPPKEIGDMTGVRTRRRLDCCSCSASVNSVVVVSSLNRSRVARLFNPQEGGEEDADGTASTGHGYTPPPLQLIHFSLQVRPFTSYLFAIMCYASYHHSSRIKESASSISGFQGSRGANLSSGSANAAALPGDHQALSLSSSLPLPLPLE